MVGRLAIVLVAAVLCVGRTIDAQNAATLKVLHWNIHHGVGTDGVYNIDRFVPWITGAGANVVSLNEVERLTSFGNEDQPARFAAMLQVATGQIWHYTFAQRDGAAKGEGNLVLTTFPIAASSHTLLSYSRSVARAQFVVNGVTVNMFSTHLDADSSTRRATQMNELKAWVSGFSQQHVIAGDFNAGPTAAEIAIMTAFAYDAWAMAKAQGTSVAYPGNEAGNTRNTRIDYVWWAKAAAQLALKGARVFDTRDASGHSPSDHRPLMATFEVGATTTLPPPTRLRIAIGGPD
jgi:endonuclease/exonuclease/phosphatase family metal-dependent hydrolase